MTASRFAKTPPPNGPGLDRGAAPRVQLQLVPPDPVTAALYTLLPDERAVDLVDGLLAGEHDPESLNLVLEGTEVPLEPLVRVVRTLATRGLIADEVAAYAIDELTLAMAYVASEHDPVMQRIDERSEEAFRLGDAFEEDSFFPDPEFDYQELYDQERKRRQRTLQAQAMSACGEVTLGTLLEQDPVAYEKRVAAGYLAVRGEEMDD